MKQTVLHMKYLAAKIKMVDFQDWQTPLAFSDVPSEYNAARYAAGLFDISYLGRIEIAGIGASAFLQKVLTRNTTKIAIGTAQTGLICNESGVILDSVLIFHLSGNRYLLTTQAVNTDKVLLWLKHHAADDVRISDTTQTVAQFALQGPHSFRVLEKLMGGAGFTRLKPRAVREVTIQGAAVLLSRTGITGGHGFEFLVPADRAEAVWDAIISSGSEEGILPCGLSCRDVLRIEMGYLLYGNEVDETRSPFEAGFASLIDFKKDFIGKDALLKLQAEGIKQKLVGFVLLDKGVPKNGGSIFCDSREIGVVTSGVQSFHKLTGIGLGYVLARYAQSGQEIEIEVRDKEITARIVDLPFLKRR